MSLSTSNRVASPTKVFLSVVLALGLIPAFSSSASADDFDPEITTFSRTSLDVLGSEELVTINFTARDDGPAGLAYAYFTFGTPLGGELRVDSEWMNRASEGSFNATMPVGVWAASGDYVLRKVEVSDREWNSTVYERGSSPQFDFAAADFHVDNPLQDTTAPTISSAQLFQDRVNQGTPVVALYGVTDDLSGVEAVDILAWSPSGNQVHLESLPQLGAAGPAVWVVPLAAPIGEYDVFTIFVRDRAGNYVQYDDDHPASVYPPGATIPPYSQPDFVSLDFTVEGVSGDRTPPELTGLSMLTPSNRRIGDLVALDYSAVDNGTGIWQVAAQWTDGKGHAIDASKTCGDRTSGPISTEIEDYRSLDTDWQLTSFAIGDYLYNQAAYHRDGSVTYYGDPGPPTHTFDLSQGDFRLEAGDPGPHEFLNTTFERCPTLGDVSLEVPDPEVLYGELVDTIGGVTVGDTALPDPIVAIHEYVEGEPQLATVVAGDEDGQYQTSFLPTANAKLKATFLGSDGRLSSGPAESEGVRISVRPRITSTLDKDRIRLGTSTSLRGSVTPPDSGEAILLQLWANGRWRSTQKTQLPADGAFSFRLHPKRVGVLRYRVVMPAHQLLGLGQSATTFLRVLRRT